MLKLEKSARNIFIRFREKERLWNRPFLTALGIALAMHVGAFLMFHIQLFKLPPFFAFPPAHVQMSQSLNDGSIGLWNQDQSLKDEYPLLSLFSSDLADVPYNLVENRSLEEKNSLTDLPLLKTAKENLVSLDLPISIKPAYKPLRVRVSGPLSQRKLLEGESISWDNSVFSQKRSLSEYSIKYAVQIDPQSGSIIWFEKKQTSGQLEIDRWIEQLLLNFVFTPDNQFESIEGTINFLVVREDAVKNKLND